MSNTVDLNDPWLLRFKLLTMISEIGKVGRYEVTKIIKSIIFPYTNKVEKAFKNYTIYNNIKNIIYLGKI